MGHVKSRALGLGVWRVGSALARCGLSLWGFGNWAVKSLQNHIKSEIPFRFGSSCVGIWDLGFGFDIGFRVAAVVGFGIWDLRLFGKSGELGLGTWDLGFGIWDSTVDSLILAPCFCG